MSHTGRYADGGSFDLPSDWISLDRALLVAALERAKEAVDSDDALDRLARFYDLKSEYAGTSFLDVKPNIPGSICAADLYAVSRLSITVTNLQGRLLLDDPDVVTTTERLLDAIDPDLTIRDLTSTALSAMWELQQHLRSLLASDTSQSNYWVFAAKLCARKRPKLFPVRDSVVCRYLSGGKELAGSVSQVQQGRLGWFSADIQVFAYLASDEELLRSLNSLANRAQARDIRVDDEVLRLLDVLLWTRGRKA